MNKKAIKTRIGLDPAGWPVVRYDRLQDERDIQTFVSRRKR